MHKKGKAKTDSSLFGCLGKILSTFAAITAKLEIRSFLSGPKTHRSGTVGCKVGDKNCHLQRILMMHLKGSVFV